MIHDFIITSRVNLLSSRAMSSFAHRVIPLIIMLLPLALASGARAADAPAPTATSEPAVISLTDLYWVPEHDTTVRGFLTMPNYCTGYYEVPEVPQTPAAGLAGGFQQELGSSDPGAAEKIYAEANSGELTLDETATLTGDVRLTQGRRQLRTQSATIDLTTRKVNIDAPVTLQDNQVVLAGSSAVADIDSRAATLTDAQFLLLQAQMRGTAASVAQDQAGNQLMQQGQFTRCEPGNNNWRFNSRQLQVDADSPFATARGAVLRVRDVPIFYTPYIRFPVTDERMSGWLFPNIGYSGEDGVDLSAPYYLNLAPHYDATIVPRYMSKRGLGVETEFRYLSSWSHSSISAAMLPSDNEFDGTYERDDFEELFPGQKFRPENRWLLNLEHQGAFGNADYGYFNTVVDYTAVSDRDYFRDLGSDLGVSSRIELERRGEINYRYGKFQARLWAQRLQRLDFDALPTYDRLPELDLSYRDELANPVLSGFPLQWSVAAKLSRFDRHNSNNLTGISAVNGWRTHVEPRLSLPMNWTFGFLNVSGGYRLTQYSLDQNGPTLPSNFDDNPDRSIGFASIDGGLFFDRDLNLFGRSLVQTLEPRLYYLRQGFEEQSQLPLFDTSPLTFRYSQLFRDNTFSGLDRIVDANQLSTGVTTRFIDSNSGREYFRASLGEIFYFRDRHVYLNSATDPDLRHSTSALVAEVSAALPGDWRATGSFIWDHHDNEVDEGSVTLQYQPGARRILNIGYRNRVEEDVEQTDFSVYWPIARRFSVVGRWNYDLVSGRSVEAFGGVEYNDCCLQVRLLARRFVDSPNARLIDTVEADKGIFIQIVFKGLAGFGDKMEGVLQRGIRGYRSPEYNGTNNRSRY